MSNGKEYAFWHLHQFAEKTPSMILNKNYSEEVNIQLAKLAREAESLAQSIRAAEWMNQNIISEAEFLEMLKNRKRV